MPPPPPPAASAAAPPPPPPAKTQEKTPEAHAHAGGDEEPWDDTIKETGQIRARMGIHEIFPDGKCKSVPSNDHGMLVARPCSALRGAARRCLLTADVIVMRCDVM